MKTGTMDKFVINFRRMLAILSTVDFGEKSNFAYQHILAIKARCLILHSYCGENCFIFNEATFGHYRILR